MAKKRLRKKDIEKLEATSAVGAAVNPTLAMCQEPHSSNVDVECTCYGCQAV